MKARYRRMLDTRRLYAWEIDCQAWPDFLLADASMGVLRRFARKVWREHGPKHRKTPTIAAGRGTEHCGLLTSYCHGRTRIVLARQHRSRGVVLHELVHAIGPFTHGERFAKVYMTLLKCYAGRAWPELIETARLMKVRGV